MIAPHGSVTVLYHHHHHFACPSEPCISWWPGPPRRKSYKGRNVKIVFPLTFDYRTEIIHYLCIIVFSLCYAPKTTNILCATPTHPFNGPLSGTTRVSQYQKGKPIWILPKQESEWQWHQLGHMQVCTSLQTDNHASTPPLVFLQAGCPSCRPTNSVKALKACATPNTAQKRKHCTWKLLLISYD